MILLLSRLALADACCAAGSAQPAVLPACDALGISFGGAGDVEYGGWAWDRGWSGAGDDGGGTATVSAAVIGRLAPWLQAGVRAPLTVTVDRLDRESRSEVGLGSGLAWLGLETPGGWPSAATPRLGLELGMGVDGPSGASPAVPLVQVGVRASGDAGRWSAWGNARGRARLTGGAPDIDLGVVVDRSVSSAVRVGVSVGGVATIGPDARYAASVGPTLVWAPTHADRLLVGVQAGLPLDGLGQNTASRVVLALDWYRTLAPTGS